MSYSLPQGSGQAGPPPRARVSAIEPLSPAIDWTRSALSPFDFRRWLNITFCLFLMQLGGGGGVPNFNFNSFGRPGAAPPGTGVPSFQELAQGSLDFLSSSEASWVILLVAGGILLGFALSALLMFLGARGAFMFLNCVVTGRDDVARPWNEYRKEGNSLFLLRLALQGIQLAIVIPAVLIVGKQVLNALAKDEFDGLMTGTVVMLGLALFLLTIAALIVNFLINSILVPRMYRQRQTVTQALPAAWGLLAANPIEVLAFAGMRILLSIGIGVIATMIGCLLCCIMWIPVIGLIPLMPLFFFDRSYSVLWIEQFGPEWEMFDRSQVPPPDSYGPYAQQPYGAPPQDYSQQPYGNPMGYGAPPPPVQQAPGPSSSYQYQEAPPPTAFTGGAAPGGYGGYPPPGSYGGYPTQGSALPPAPPAPPAPMGGSALAPLPPLPPVPPAPMGLAALPPLPPAPPAPPAPMQGSAFPPPPLPPAPPAGGSIPPPPPMPPPGPQDPWNRPPGQ